MREQKSHIALSDMGEDYDAQGDMTLKRLLPAQMLLFKRFIWITAIVAG